MSGLVSVVTGATSGIGLQAAGILVERGENVIGIGRSPQKCAEAERALRARRAGATVSFVAADLSTLAGMHRAAEAVRARTDRVDVLINNAGTFSFRRQETEDGLERQLAVNWLAAFVLTGLLMPCLDNADAARVVTVSSGSHFSGRMRWEDLQLRRGYNGLKAYDASKLATVLFTRELARRLGGGAGIATYAVDPGLVKTEIGAKGAPLPVRLVWKLRTRNGISARSAAESVCWCAVNAQAAGRTGMYWKEREVQEPSPHAIDATDALRLWAIGEAISEVFYPAERGVMQRTERRATA